MTHINALPQAGAKLYPLERLETGVMLARIGILSIAGSPGLLAAAEAATPFDGTYQPYSLAQAIEPFITAKGAVGVCPDRRPGPLTIENGQVRCTAKTGRNIAAAVTRNGSFTMGFTEPDGFSPMHVIGTIDRNGTVRARQQGKRCRYDFVRRK